MIGTLGWTGRPGAFVLVFVLVFAAAPGRTAPMDEVAQRYARDGGVGGRFEQRLISDGSQARVYKGRYHYSAERGLLWEVTMPDQGRLIIDHNGDTQARGELGGLSALQKRTVGRLIVAMVALDDKVLERYYRIEQSANDENFRITLEARPRWRKVAGTVTIRGTQLVDSVTMALPDGRTMVLSLTHDK